MSKHENAFDKLLRSVSKMYKKNAELKNCCKSSPILSPAKPIVKQLLDTLETENVYLQKCCNNDENNPMENNPFERYGNSTDDTERGSGNRRKSRRVNRRGRKAARTKRRRKRRRQRKGSKSSRR